MEFINHENIINSHGNPKVEEPDFFNTDYNNSIPVDIPLNKEEHPLSSIPKATFIDGCNDTPKKELEHAQTAKVDDSDITNEPISASEAYEKFIRDLIVFYQEQPVLWNRSHPQNRNKIARAKAMEEILVKCSHYPEANLDYIKTKLDTIKSTFRREYSKVQESKKTARSPEEIFKPTLWYYNDMLFFVGADPEKDKEAVVEVVKDKPNFIWNREDTLYLIEIMKTYPILYSVEAPWNKKEKAKKYASIKKVAEVLSEKTGKIYDFSEVTTKISRLKNQYLKEIKRIKKGQAPSLWCYNMLSFLGTGLTSQKTKKKLTKFRKMKEERTSDLEKSNDSDKCLSNKQGSRKSRRISKKISIKNAHSVDTSNSEEESKDVLSKEDRFDISEDIFDVIGKHVVLKLNEMSQEQKKFAENLVNEILYHGIMENLRWDTKLTV